MAMKVRAVLYPQLDLDALKETGYIPQREANRDSEPCAVSEDGRDVNPAWREWLYQAKPTPTDEFHEAAGRGCYQSWNRPNPKTATNKGYLKNIIDVEHESVLGHGHVTLYVEGVSRALLLELERHAEHMNINLSVMSQRYVDHGKKSSAGVVVPPLFDEAQEKGLKAAFGYLQYKYDKTVEELMSQGHSRKEARGAARAFLPEATETKFFVTGSIRAWRDIIRKRATEGADIEIRLFALEVLKELVRVAPNSVQDFAELHNIEGEK